MQGVVGRHPGHRFWANQAWLLMHATAHLLCDTFRHSLVQVGSAQLPLETLRQRLIKFGGRVRYLATHVQLRLA